MLFHVFIQDRGACNHKNVPIVSLHIHFFCEKKNKDNHLSTLTFINYLIHIFWAVILFIFLTSIYHKIGQCLYLVLMKARWRLVKFSTCILIPTSSFPLYEIVSHVSLFIVRCIATLHSSLQVKTFFTIVEYFLCMAYGSPSLVSLDNVWDPKYSHRNIERCTGTNIQIF